MSLAEAVANGVFGVISSALGILVFLWIFPVILRHLTKNTGGKWGEPDGSLHPFSLKRLWCRHPVSYYGKGTHGLWAVWCDYCGRRIDKK